MVLVCFHCRERESFVALLWSLDESFNLETRKKRPSEARTSKAISASCEGISPARPRTALHGKTWRKLAKAQGIPKYQKISKNIRHYPTYLTSGESKIIKAYHSIFWIFCPAIYVDLSRGSKTFLAFSLMEGTLSKENSKSLSWYRTNLTVWEESDYEQLWNA